MHGIWLKRWLGALDDTTRGFILMCLQPEPDKRATVDDLLNHPWLATMEWMDAAFERGIEQSMTRTASIHATVMACKRLRMALLSNARTKRDPQQGAQKDARRQRQQSLMVPKATSKAPNLIKHAYYTPQAVGVGTNPAQGTTQQSSSIYWLDTPGGAMVSPKLNKSGGADALVRPAEKKNPVDQSCTGGAALPAKEKPTAEASKRSLTRRLLEKLKM